MTTLGGLNIPGFSIVEHPSDVGIEARGASMSEAFEQAAYGMISILVDREAIRAVEERTVVVSSTDAEQLLVKWLSELLYLYDAQHFLPSAIAITTFAHGGLCAAVTGEIFDASRHTALLDVKAVTYHQILIDEVHHVVRVVFDV